MKRLTILIVMAVCFMLSCILVGCTKEQIKKSSIILDSTTISVEADGGNYSVGYKIENPVSDILADASVESSWVKIVKVTPSKVEFFVDPNLQSEPREALLTLDYNKAKATLKITQVEAGMLAGAFKLVINEVTTNSVTYSAYPKDMEMMYDLTVWDADWYDTLDEDEIWGATIGRYESVAQAAGMSLEEYLEQDTKNIKRGNTENFTVSDIPASYRCYAVAVGISPQGERITDFVKEEFVTKEPEVVQLSFELSVEINETDGTQATISAIPSDDTLPYFITSARKIDLEAVEYTPEQYAKFVLQTLIEFYTSFGMEREQVLALVIHYGESSSSITDMDLEITNIAIAIGTDDEGNINENTVATTYEFRTPDAEDSDNEFTVNITDVNVDRFNIDIAVTNEDQYALVVDLSENYVGKSDQEIIETLQLKRLLDSPKSGNYSGKYLGLAADSEYDVFVLGTNNGAATTEIVKNKIKTLPKGNVNDFQFSATVDNITAHTAVATATPQPETVLYLWGVVNASLTSQQVKDQIESVYNENKIYYQDRLDFMLDNGVRGNATLNVTGLLSDTQYKVFAICVDDATGEYASDVIFTSEFRTQTTIVSDATIELQYDKYWDVDELAEIYPEDFGQYAYSDRLCLPVEVSTTGDAQYTYFVALEGDYTDVSAVSDEELALTLAMDGVGITGKTAQLILKYDITYTLAAVAVDSDGYFSEVFRNKVNLSDNGAAPIDEYELPMSKNNVNVGNCKHVYTFFNMYKAEMKNVRIEEPSIYHSPQLPSIDYSLSDSSKKVGTVFTIMPVSLNL